MDWWDEATRYCLLGQLGFYDARTKYAIDDIARRIPLVGDYLTVQDNLNFYDDYFKNHPDAGGYDNIKYHKVNLGVGSAVQNGLRFASKNIANFYDNW